MTQKEKYVHKPYVFQEWPKMVYHPKTGKPLTCSCEDDVPEGYLTNPGDIGLDEEAMEIVAETETEEAAEAAKLKQEEITERRESSAKRSDKPKAKPKSSAKPKTKTKKKKAKAKPTALEELELIREDAEALLTDEKVKFDEDASDDEIAAMVKELLDDESE